MYGNYTVVCNSAAGRRRYMQYLVPFVLSSDIIDRYDIWINTMDLCDIEFFKELSKKYPKVNLVWQPDGIVNGTKTINAFFRNCIDENTIYIRLDDDIIWVEPGFFEKIIKFRVDNPQYLCISPLVINNPKSTYILQVKNKLWLNNYYNAETLHDIFWKNGDFAYQLHTWFIDNYLVNDTYDKLYCGEVPIGVTRFSINSICWFGRDLKKVNGIVEGDEEEFMSCILPTRLNKPCCYYCDAVIVHFAFYTQREQLDKMDILNKYATIQHKKWEKEPIISSIESEVLEIIDNIEKKKNLINAQEVPYHTIPQNRKNKKGNMIMTLKKVLPPIVVDCIKQLRNKHIDFITEGK